MSGLNKDNSTIRYYKGLIRDLQAQLKDTLARLKVLEDRVTKLSLTNNNIEGYAFANDGPSKFNSGAQGGTNGTGGGGLTSSQIKALVSQWIENGELPISSHNHTSDQTGGDAFGALGAKLQ